MSGAPRVPKLRKHPRGSVVVLDGKYVYCGPYGSEQAQEKYDRKVAEWLANGRRLPAAADPEETPLLINEVIAAYWAFVQGYYVKNGEPTSEQDTIRQALRFVRRLYGSAPAKDFGPKALKAVRAAMIDHPITRKVKVRDPMTGKVMCDPVSGEALTEDRVIRHGLARKFINKQIGRIKRMFAWAVEEELLPVTVFQSLLTVKGLKKGKTKAREKARIKPVPPEHVDAVLPHLPKMVRRMVEVHRLCGGRPQDIVLMRAANIDVSQPVWEYHPANYKTEHHNDGDDPDKERVIYLGPRAQAILKPLLSETARQAEGGAKALAAYRLGLLSQTFPMWHVLFLKNPEYEWGTADGVRVVIKELNEAVITLGTEIPVNVYGELRTWMEHEAERWTTIFAAVSGYHEGPGRNQRLVEEAVHDPSPRLRDLLDSAFESLPVLKPWFRVGVEIGHYQWSLDHLEDTSTVPPVTGIVAAVRTLSDGTVRLFSVLDALCDRTNESPGLSPRVFLTQVIGAANQPEDNEMYGANFDTFVVGNLLRSLDHAIQEGLQGVAELQMPAAEREAVNKKLKPQWVKKQGEEWVGELRVGDRVVRRVRPLATNIITILDTFEEEDWPDFIASSAESVGSFRLGEGSKSVI